jgi:hypothetical protein
MFATDTEQIPPGLDKMQPGYVLACFLGHIDVDTLSGYDRIVVLRAHQRMASHYLAHTYRDMTSVADAIGVEEEIDKPGFAAEAAAAEVRAALRLTRRAADVEMAFAIELRQRLPLVWDALSAGDIDVRRARVIANATIHLSMAAAQDVVDHIIPDAGLLTTGQLGARIRNLALEVDPEGAARRYEHAVEDRRIVAEPTDSGTTNLFGINLPPDRVAAVTKRVNGIARGLRGGDETRSMDQLRADVFLDILEGTAEATGTAVGTLDLRVDLATLAELTEAPGELAGYGPVIADIARRVADKQMKAAWRYTLVDADSGQALDTGPTHRRPTRDQRRIVQMRDATCIFPGCRMPAIGCDIDHRIPWAEGHQTITEDLAPACRYDHNNIRHRFGWTYERQPDGDYVWTSRLGHTYNTSARAP